LPHLGEEQDEEARRMSEKGAALGDGGNGHGTNAHADPPPLGVFGLWSRWGTPPRRRSVPGEGNSRFSGSSNQGSRQSSRNRKESSCRTRRPSNVLAPTNGRGSRPALRPVSSCVKKCTIFARENTAPNRPSRPSRSDCRRLAARAWICRPHPRTRRN